MPELPDLQVFSHNLSRFLKGKTLRKINVREASKLNVTAIALKKQLEGKKLMKIVRDGKELLFTFGNKDIMSLHLMLHGNLYLLNPGETQKHSIAEFEFDNEKVLFITDWQRQATLLLNPEPRPAPDALADEMDFNFLKAKLNSKKMAIKNILLDQKVLRGIGNAYADEILWHARLSPFSIGNKIPDKSIRTLLKSIKKVLTDAEKHILKSDPDRITGELRDFLKIHNSKKKESPGKAPIKHSEAGGRKTYYTDEQVRY